MSDEIKIGLKLQGAQQAQNEARKTAEAVEELGEAANEASQGFDALMTGNTAGAPPFEEWVNSAEKAKDAAAEVGSAIEGAAESTGLFTEEEKKAIEEGRKLNKTLADQDVAAVKASRSAEAQARSIREVEKATKALLLQQVAVALQDTISQLREATGETGALREELGGLNGALEVAESSIGIFSVGLTTFIATGNPAAAVAASVVTGLKGVADAYSEMKAAQKDLADAPKRHAEWMEYIRQAQESLRRDARTEFQLNTYRAEADQLERAARTLQRINELRSVQSGADVARAQADVTIAQNNGGDVKQAEAKLLSAQLTAELDNLDGRLAESQKAADDAANAAERSRVLANDASVNNPKEFEKLSAAADEAAKKAADAIQARDFDAAKFVAEKTRIIANFEASLSTMETDLGAGVSKETQAVRDSIYATLKDQMASISSGVPTLTGQASAPVVEKIAAVTKGIESERAETTRKISAIPIPSENTEAIAMSSRKLENALNRMGEAVIGRDERLVVVIDDILRRLSQTEGAIRRLWNRPPR
jgi:myosin heavy subunit